MIQLDDFLLAVGRYADERVTGDSFLWRDLGIFGDDWDLGFVPGVFSVLGAEAHCREFDVYKFIPTDSEVGVFGRLTSTRTIPDIKLKELFVFLELKASI